VVEHDVAPGPLKQCQVCGSSHLVEVIDLGHQPPCDALLSAEDLDKPEPHYPLRLFQCPVCLLAQLDYVLPSDVVYPRNYPYRAGISWPVVEAHRHMAEELVTRFGKGFVVDVGCNDGTLLLQMKRLGCSVMGFEPTDVASIAQESGVTTAQRFFSEKAVEDTIGTRHKAHIITFTNVFAHMATLGSVMRGVTSLLSKDGVLVIENHYLLDILERNQFDSIYHEHVRTYTLTSLEKLFSYYGMEVFDVERVPRYGGNIRVFVGWKGKHPVESSVRQLQEHEDRYDFAGASMRFREGVSRARDDFMQFLYGVHGKVVGCSAPGRASTLLNYFGVQRSEQKLHWTGELSNSLKLGKYLPGSHIAVVPNRLLKDEDPPYIVLLAWHYGTEIAARLRAEGIKSRLVAPLPFFTLMD